MAEITATRPARKASAKRSFAGLVRAELVKKHPIIVDGKRRWLTLEDIMQRHLVFAQARGSKKAMRLSLEIKKKMFARRLVRPNRLPPNPS
jgi:hypothetical protein